jgi:hypothetical protein
MKNITQTLTKYTIWAFIFAATSYVYAVGTWEEPAGAGGQNNTDAPINVGPIGQNKSGNFGAASFCDETGANCMSASTIVNTSATSQTKLGAFTTTGFRSLDDAYFATDISVATVADPTGLGLVGLFNGNVGASQYCDSSGANCKSIASVATGDVTATRYINGDRNETTAIGVHDFCALAYHDATGSDAATCNLSQNATSKIWSVITSEYSGTVGTNKCGAICLDF